MSWQKLIALHMNILNKVEGGLIFLKMAMKAYTVKKMKKSQKNI